MNNLTILNSSIRSLDNLYSLNDLHKASGSETKHRPTFFIKNDQTQELIFELNRENAQCENSHSVLNVVNGGLHRGTYACEELALAYAMWISPKFHLVVLRAFIAMHKGQSAPQQLTLPTPEPKYPAEFTAAEIHNLVWLLLSHQNMNILLGELIGPLDAIKSGLKPTVYSHHHEYKHLIKACHPILKRLIEPFKLANPMEYERIQARLAHH